MNNIKWYICRMAATMLFVSLLGACDRQDDLAPNGDTVPEGMVEIRPVLPGMFGSIPRDATRVRSVTSRAYDSKEETNEKLIGNPLLRLPQGSTVWLIAEGTTTDGKKTYVKKSYVVLNPADELTMSYLVPCTVDDNGNMVTMEGSPLYLKNGNTYKFYAISPARKLDETKFAEGIVGFQVTNGEAFYANDCRYERTTPETVTVTPDAAPDGHTNPEDVQIVDLSPMINQTAELKFQIDKGYGVHDLDIQPAGIQISGLQNDSPAAGPYGDSNGLYWHMSLTGDEPIKLQHADKEDVFYCYDYTIDAQERVNIEVPILPMWDLSKPIIVIFRLKVNGVPTTYEMMLNEKDFKAGYSYGYRGKVAIDEGITVVAWQYVSWELDQELPTESQKNE